MQLGWIQSYLSYRKFKGYYEGCYSSTKKSSSGVPQGAIISPILFNVLLYDIVKVNRLYYSEYADNVAIYGVDNDVQRLLGAMQATINNFDQ